jgi:hypothetical protein
MQLLILFECCQEETAQIKEQQYLQKGGSFLQPRRNQNETAPFRVPFRIGGATRI